MRVMFVEPLEAFTSRRVANSSYQTFTALHKPLHGSNSLEESLLACMSLYVKLTAPDTCTC